MASPLLFATPPNESAGVTVTVADASPGVAVTDFGANGTPAGVTADAVVGLLVPALLSAVIESVAATPFCKLRIRHARSDAEALHNTTPAAFEIR